LLCVEVGKLDEEDLVEDVLIGEECPTQYQETEDFAIEVYDGEMIRHCRLGGTEEIGEGEGGDVGRQIMGEEGGEDCAVSSEIKEEVHCVTVEEESVVYLVSVLMILMVFRDAARGKR